MAELTAKQRAYVNRRSRVRDLDSSETGGELNIVPFLDIVVNIIMFLLATTQVSIALAEIETQMPHARPIPGRTTGQSLNVTLVEHGIIVASTSGKFLSGCERTTSGHALTVGMQGLDYDWVALSACAERIHSRPEFQNEDQITLSADPGISYDAVIHAMDALGSRGDQPLFSNILLSAGVR